MCIYKESKTAKEETDGEEERASRVSKEEGK